MRGRGQATILALLAFNLTSCIYARIFYFNIPTLDAQDDFDGRVVRAAPDATSLPESERPVGFRMTEADAKRYESFDGFLEENDTRALLVVHDGAVVYERYFGETDPDTRLADFSISKTFASVLVGCAVEDGFLDSMDDPLTRYMPELASKRGYDVISLDQLLRMTSGIDFDEESPAGARLYYTKSLRDEIYSYGIRWPAGTRYAYGSVNIALLGDAVERRLVTETLSHYFQRRVWQPIGAEHDALWSLDSDKSGMEKLFAGFNATVRDHARLGLLFLHKGMGDHRRVLPPSWVERSLALDEVTGTIKTTDGLVERGHYQWFWTRDHQAFFAKGYNGQYVFVVPSKNAVFVRFGDGYGEVDWPALFMRLSNSL